VSWADPNKVREVVVVGSDQRIVFDDVKTTEQVRVYEKGVTPPEAEASSYGEYRFLMRDGDIISPKIEVSEPLKNQCRHFLESVVQGSRPLTDGWAGLQVVRVMKAVDRSVKLNGAPVSLGETSALTSTPEIAASVWEVSNEAAVTATEVTL
jgi:predicted dehydrogenase